MIVATHPEGEAAEKFGSLPGVRFTEGVVFGFDGPDPLGPEAAGGVIVLQGTVIDADKAPAFWGRTADLAHAARESEGFIRFIGFGEGLSSYAIGFWRTAEEAVAFAQGAAHREAVRDQVDNRNLYSQFAGVWTAHTIRPRTFYCDCGQRTPAPAEVCPSCGAAFTDVFELQRG